MTNTIYIHQPEKAFSFTRLPNFLFEVPTFKPLSNEAKEPPHSSPCPTRQRFCTPLSCAGQSYPARMGGRMTADGFTCTIPSARWLTCSTVGGKRRSIPCGNCSMPDWWRFRNKAVENPTAFSPNPMKRFQRPTSRNPVMVRRRAENRTHEVRKSLLRSTKTGRYIEIQR